jgi:hypothetical protein
MRQSRLQAGTALNGMMATFVSSSCLRRQVSEWLCRNWSKIMILICMNKSENENRGEGQTPTHPELNPVPVWHHPKKRAL